MPKKPKKEKWKRWVEETKEFPKPKYRFTELLKREGDYVETFPMTQPDVKRIRWAAHFWAHHKNKCVRTVTIPDYQNGVPMWRVRVELIADKRTREIPDI